MQSCSLCHSNSPDSALVCINCSADLSRHSTTAVALARFQDNPRVEIIRLVVSEDACPACQEFAGNYAKDEAPALPVRGCSNPDGCKCFYEPLLNVIYP
jgi:hypothetical protein